MRLWKKKMIKLISHYHYRIDVFKEVKCIDFKVYVKIHVKKKSIGKGLKSIGKGLKTIDN